MMRSRRRSTVLATVAVVALMFTACGDESTVTVSVSIHDENATISVPGTLNNSYTLYASQDENCDVDGYKDCAAGEMHSLSAATTSVTVEALTTAATAYFTLKNVDSGVSKSFTVAPATPAFFSSCWSPGRCL